MSSGKAEVCPTSPTHTHTRYPYPVCAGGIPSTPTPYLIPTPVHISTHVHTYLYQRDAAYTGAYLHILTYYGCRGTYTLGAL